MHESALVSCSILHPTALVQGSVLSFHSMCLNPARRQHQTRPSKRQTRSTNAADFFPRQRLSLASTQSIHRSRTRSFVRQALAINQQVPQFAIFITSNRKQRCCCPFFVPDSEFYLTKRIRPASSSLLNRFLALLQKACWPQLGYAVHGRSSARIGYQVLL